MQKTVGSGYHPLPLGSLMVNGEVVSLVYLRIGRFLSKIDIINILKYLSMLIDLHYAQRASFTAKF